jgi:hypothetical protein
MSILAARFRDRVDRLIYLDSGFDYRQLLDRVGVATPLGSPPAPGPAAYDHGTVADYTLWAERSSGAGFPESEVQAMFHVAADGIVQGSATAPETPRAMLDGIEPAPLTKIRAPTLAIYAAPTSVEVMYPSWYGFDDSSRQRGRWYTRPFQRSTKCSGRASNARSPDRDKSSSPEPDTSNATVDTTMVFVAAPPPSSAQASRVPSEDSRKATLRGYVEKRVSAETAAKVIVDYLDAGHSLNAAFDPELKRAAC